MSADLELLDWRRQVSELYAGVRAATDPERAHARWRGERDRLFRTHPQSPLPADDPLRESGLPYWPYDPALRFSAVLHPPTKPISRMVATGAETTLMQLVGWVELPSPIGASLDVWSLQQYAGGIFLPLRDGTAGDTSYGGGRYALDSAKGADLGGDGDRLVVDFNFLYHPSCRYSSDWQCPLAADGNTITAPVRAGERL
jgi:uncharacterized protein